MSTRGLVWHPSLAEALSEPWTGSNPPMEGAWEKSIPPSRACATLFDLSLQYHAFPLDPFEHRLVGQRAVIVPVFR